MAGAERVTVTLPDDLVRDIDRRHAELHRSLQNPHPESAQFAEQGLEEWSRGLPEEDTEALVDSGVGKPAHWIPGEGWAEGQA